MARGPGGPPVPASREAPCRAISSPPAGGGATAPAPSARPVPAAGRGGRGRPAGARQPRGTLSRDLLPSGGRVGDVVRAELESGLDGVEVISVSGPKTLRRSADAIQRIEVVG